jgi:DNA-binding LacI/PurR family transcriptional regulator
MVTLRDIAKMADVSVGTVSRVINNMDRVKPETREKIKSIIKEVGYECDRNAVILGKRKKGISRRKVKQSSVKKLELLFWEKYLSSLSLDPVYTKMMEGAQRYCQKSGCEFLVKTISKQFESNPEPETILEKGVEGYFLIGQIPKSFIRFVEKNNIPSVHLGSSLNYAKNRTLVRANDFYGGYQAVQHLISLGHNRIGFISDNKNKGSFRERMRGYIISILESGIQLCMQYYQYPGQDALEPSQALKYLMSLKNPPTALFCANDEIAFKVLKTCQEIGLEVPGNLSVMGFDNSVFAEYSNPPLTTVHQASLEAGETAAIELISSIIDKNYIPRTVILDTSLVIRNSTAKCIEK